MMVAIGHFKGAAQGVKQGLRSAAATIIISRQQPASCGAKMRLRARLMLIHNTQRRLIKGERRHRQGAVDEVPERRPKRVGPTVVAIVDLIRVVVRVPARSQHIEKVQHQQSGREGPPLSQVALGEDIHAVAPQRAGLERLTNCVTRIVIVRPAGQRVRRDVVSIGPAGMP